MNIQNEGCCGETEKKQQTCDQIIAEGIGDGAGPAGAPQIIDGNITMLIAAGAAMAANCEDCLNKIVPDLIDAGVPQADIRRAVEIGQFVKDKPAARMKEAADILAGTQFLPGTSSNECPAGEVQSRAACS